MFIILNCAIIKYLYAIQPTEISIQSLLSLSLKLVFEICFFVYLCTLFAQFKGLRHIPYWLHYSAVVDRSFLNVKKCFHEIFGVFSKRVRSY